MTDQPVLVSNTTLAEALLALQADLPVVAKRQTAKVETTKGPGYTYKYAGLAAVMSAILPRLNRLGLVFIARPSMVEGRFVLCCELVHVASGERLEAQYPITAAPNAPAQAIGSAISYGRRYCLTALTGVVAEEDDDGRAASARYDDDDQQAFSRRREPSEDLERRKKRLFALYGEVGPKERGERLADLSEHLGRPVTSSNDLDADDVELAIAALEKRKREQRAAARQPSSGEGGKSDA